MNEGTKHVFQRLFGKQKDKKTWIWVIVGLAGIGIIAATEWIPRRTDESPSPQTVVSAQELETALENRIGALLREVEGVGNCRVMVTLEHGTQFVYAKDTTASAQAGQSGSEKTLMVESDDGPVGLLITEVQPTVKGVAVVCDGGDRDAVKERVTAIISTAFRISSQRVCVVKQQ